MSRTTDGKLMLADGYGMKYGLLECPRCGNMVGAGALGGGNGQACLHCGAVMRVAAFPAALGETLQGGYGEALENESDSSCFHHPDRVAAVPCGLCGRFLCSLCDIEMRGRHYCPACLETAIREGELPDLQTEYTRYDLLALAAACLPFALFMPVALLVLPFSLELGLAALVVLLFFPTVVTAPIALYVALRYRKQTSSPLIRRRGRLPAAVILASAESLLWAAAVVMFFAS